MVFAAIAIVASLIMSWIPARQAARVPIAESLRYE
jgi:ABC-type lipoprotein release transport system permease subunit